MEKPAKPYHLMTPEERTALRIAQNRAIAEKTKAIPPAKSSNDYTRATPEEHLGSVIRKLKP